MEHLNLDKILNSADKTNKPKRKRRKNRGGFVVTTVSGNMTMDQMIDLKCAQADFFEDAAECGDRGDD